MKRLVVDLDETVAMSSKLTAPEPDDFHWKYEKADVNLPMVKRLREYRDAGFEIVIFSARNMNTYKGNVGLINANTLPRILGWLDRHDVPYDEVLVGKPWCGTEGFYIDDRAIRPSEFLTLDLAQIHALIAKEKFRVAGE